MKKKKSEEEAQYWWKMEIGQGRNESNSKTATVKEHVTWKGVWAVTFIGVGSKYN